jgi:hypothetical protein
MSSSTLASLVLLMIAIPVDVKYLNVVFICISLMSTDYTSFHMLIGHLCIFLGEISVCLFAHC